MKREIRKTAKYIAWLCTLVYFASYLMRINFAVMLVKVCEDMNLEKSALAVVLMALTISYGVGQIISGFLGDKLNPRHLLSVGLAIAASCNIAMYFSTAVPVMTVVWAINGFAHALLWPPIVRLLSVYLTEKEYSYAVVRVSWGSSFATILLYMLCPLCLGFMTWRQIILTCAIIGIGILITWVIANPRIFKEEINKTVVVEEEDHKTETIKLPKKIYLAISMIFVGIIIMGILRDGVTNWMPSYLKETYNIAPESAIFFTVTLAIGSVISFGLFDWVQRRFFTNEVNCATFIFFISAVSSALLYVAHRFVKFAALDIVLMAIIVACMHGVNLMLISIVPRRFAKIGKVATYSGILNAFTYIGAAASDYGFAVLAEKFGWGFTISTWVVVSIVGIVVCKLAVMFGWIEKYREYLS